jgi:hypothetical protein
VKTKIYILSAVLFILTSCNIFSQKAQSVEDNYNVAYNANSEETILGQVRSIDNIYSLDTTSLIIRMIIYTNNGDMIVHLGPADFLDNQNFKIKADDNVTVIGSRIYFEGNQVIIAQKVIIAGELIKLRDDDGYPLWLGKSIRSEYQEE